MRFCACLFVCVCVFVCFLHFIFSFGLLSLSEHSASEICFLACLQVLTLLLEREGEEEEEDEAARRQPFGSDLVGRAAALAPPLLRAYAVSEALLQPRRAPLLLAIALAVGCATNLELACYAGRVILALASKSVT